MSDIPADTSIEFPPTARRTRPVARRIGWVLVAVSSLLIRAYAVFIIVTSFASYQRRLRGTASPARSASGRI